MRNKKRFYFGAAVMSVIVVFFSASCDMDKEESKPWDGYEISKMNYGRPGFVNIPNGIPKAKPGDIYWYYIDAEEDVTYTVQMSTLIGVKPPASYAQNPAFADMTGYKEDGTVFWDTLNEDYYNMDMAYYSPKAQKLYIRFKISGAVGGGEGYFIFGYTTD